GVRLLSVRRPGAPHEDWLAQVAQCRQHRRGKGVELPGVTKERRLLHGHPVEEVLERDRVGVEARHIGGQLLVVTCGLVTHRPYQPATDGWIETEPDSTRQQPGGVVERPLGHVDLMMAAAMS